MSYCPIQVKITNDELKKQKQANYILQVWKKGGSKVFERNLQGLVDLWTISYNHLIFKPSSLDKDSDYYHIIDLETHHEFLVQQFIEDPTYKYITFSDGVIYVANEHNLKLGTCSLDESHINHKQELSNIHSITINKSISSIHGLFMTYFYHRHHALDNTVSYEKETKVFLALETKDQQIDFNYLDIKNQVSLNAPFSYTLTQYREVIPRKHYSNFSDPIDQFQAVFHLHGIETNLVSVVKRRSGAIDLYYEGQKVHSSHDVKIRNIDLTYDSIYFNMDLDFITNKELKADNGHNSSQHIECDKKKRELDDQKKTLTTIDPKEERVRMVDIKWGSKISYDNSTYNSHYTLKNLFFQRIKKACKLYNSFCLVGTVLLVAHGNTISIFSILTNKWTRHFTFSHEIKEIFREGHGANGVLVLLEDGSIQVIKQQKVVNTGEEFEPWVVDPSKTQRLTEKLINYHQDRENNQWLMFITQREGEKNYGVYALYEHKLYDISEQLDEFHCKPNIVFLYSVNPHTEFIIQHGHYIDLYTLDFEEDRPDGLSEGEEENKETENELESIEHTQQSDKLHEDLKKPKYDSKPVVRRTHQFDCAEKDDHGKTIKNNIKCRISDGVKFQLHDKHHHNKQKYFLLLSDHQNLYKIDVQNHKFHTFEDQSCLGLYFSDKNYLYSLSHKSKDRGAGLRLYDVENMIEKNQDYSYLLTNEVQVGCQGLIDFSHENERISFLSSYDSIEVIPLLHRNTMSFIGMKNRKEYLATKVIDGKLIALSNKGKLYSWDMITGKLLINAEKAQSFKQYRDYDVHYWYDEDEEKKDYTYRKEWYKHVLLRSKDYIADYDENSYHGHGGIDEQLENQISYNHRIEKKFYNFKVIEIISDTEIVEHFSFVHPVYPGTVQYMYFSKDLKYMYERLKYERHFLYERTQLPHSKEVNWKYIHRFHRLPIDLLDVTQYPFIFTPNFSKYIDVNHAQTKLIIRDTFDHEREITEIPEELVNGEEEPIQNAVRRLRWIDEKHIHIINHEGIERIIDTTDGFKEIQFNFIPLYDKEICTKQHYILDAPSYQLDQCLKTLKKRYQQYKSSFYLRRSQNSNYDLYQDIFCVDYRIDNCEGPFETDMSFSFLHWNLMEQLHQGKITVDQIDHEQIELLFYNILPHGNTILHILHDNGDLMEALLKVAHPHAEDRARIGIHIPFLQNMDGLSPIHLCTNAKEYRYINVLLEYLKGYDIDHHSRAIVENLPVMIEHALPNFIPYLESRMKQTEHATKITKGMLKNQNSHNICPTSMWIGEGAIEQLFQPAPIEQDVKLEFIDVPDIHRFSSETGIEFFKQLSDSEDMRLFETTAVKKLIEFQWPVILKFTVLKLFLPFVCFQASYLVYMHIFFADQGTKYSWISYYISAGLLGLLAVYHLLIEIFQLLEQGFGYFSQVWNYLDIIPPALIITFITLDQVHYFKNADDKEVMASLQAIISLTIWLKFLYFLRIFDSTGYLIRIIIQVCIDMRHFLMLLLLTFIAFGDAIYNINNANEEQFYSGGFLGGIAYVYRMVLGDFDTEEKFGTVALPLMWILFLMCTVLNMIIMLNLLIAIISESFANVNSVSKQASYQEKARIISENMYLVPASVKKSYCPENSYLLIAIDTEQELLEKQECIDEKLKQLKKGIKQSNKKNFKKLSKKIKKTREDILKSLHIKSHGLLGSNASFNFGEGSIANYPISQSNHKH